MTTSTPNLALVLYNSTTDSAEYFSNFRAVIAGTSLSSNFYKIDTAYGNMQSNINSIQAGAYLTSATYISANYYEATVSGISSYNTGMKIILSLNVASAGTVTLNINSLGIKSVMKIDSSGTPVNISSGELMVGRYYFFVYDGTRWVWVDAVSAEQIYVSGTSGNFLRVSSGNIIEDSGSSPSTFAPASKGVTNGDAHNHVGGDGDPIPEGGISLSDVTTNNSNTSNHGFFPKLSNSGVEFVNGLGNWYDVSPSYKNFVINGGFEYAQRQPNPSASATVTNLYSADRWKCLAQNNNVLYNRSNGAIETGLRSPYYGSFTKVTSAGKIMIVQPIEGFESLSLRSQTITFQGMMKTSSSKSIRMGVIELQSAGTMDTIPTIISAWGADSTDPTLGTNLAYISGTSTKSVTTSWTKFSVTVSVPSNSKNLLLAVWSDSQFSINDTLNMAEFMVSISPSAMSWIAKSSTEEYLACLRFCERMSFSTDNASYPPIGFAISTTAALVQVPCFPKRNSSNTLSVSAAGDFTFLTRTLSSFTGVARLPNFMIGSIATASTWTSGSGGFLVTGASVGGSAYLLVENEL